ncbi:MAG: hypothetical protein RIS47_1580, partial [Bacteroidota bacterium]
MTQLRLRFLLVFTSILFTTYSFCQQSAQQYVSKVWQPDKGDGSYQNPIIYADYSDPDVCAAGDNFYMVSSSFNCIPGLQILQSKDLVNWTIISAAIPNALIPTAVFQKPQHGNGVWAPSIRFHNNEFYIFFGDPDFGIYMTKAPKAEGPWSPLKLIKAAKGNIDACPLWDTDGKAYVVHGWAGSRAGLKSILSIFEIDPITCEAISPSRIIFDGHENNETIEGSKFYKKGDWYYIFAPAGGVPTGWQLAMRSKNVYGPYEYKIVLAQGKTAINGPHQGAWVSTTTGEDWFLHFQDVGPYGRIVHLQPMVWKKDWPVIGDDPDGDGCGQPVLRHKKPDVGGEFPICNPQESDEFNALTLAPQWQWHANPKETWIYLAADKGFARLYAAALDSSWKNLWDVPNLLLQKTPANKFSATVKLQFTPNPKFIGERMGLVMMGRDYGFIGLENTAKGLVLTQNLCK